jgi:sporulation protein YlmC with PRC-barrel domain
VLANNLSLHHLMELRGRPVYARSGERLGTMECILYDDDTGRAGWIGIRRGPVRRRIRLAPAGGAAMREDGIRVPYSAALVDSAPRPKKGDALATRVALYRHYHLSFPGESYPISPRINGTGASTRTPKGAVSLKKWVETHRERRRVPLRREVLRIHREPVYLPVDGVELGAQEVTITLFDEEPVVTTRVVAKERITMDKDREPRSKPLPDPKKGEGDGSDDYRTPEDPAPEIGDKHDHHFAGQQRGNRQTA